MSLYEIQYKDPVPLLKKAIGRWLLLRKDPQPQDVFCILFSSELLEISLLAEWDPEILNNDRDDGRWPFLRLSIDQHHSSLCSFLEPESQIGALIVPY